MRARSWMAALALTAAASVPIGRGLSAWGQGPTQASGAAKSTQGKSSPDPGKVGDTSKPDAAAGKKKPVGSNFPTMCLDLSVEGLGAAGCDVEVKPANAGCRFQAVPAKHVPSYGKASVTLRDVEIRGADKMCTVAITVRQPGQPTVTVYRGYRVSSLKPGTVPTFPCFVSARIASSDSKSVRR
jgi:hypothetical protein